MTPFSTAAMSHSRSRTCLPVAGMLTPGRRRKRRGVRSGEEALVNRGVARLVLVEGLELGIRESISELLERTA